MSNAKNFFVAVGGTGQHVALAYADLLALARHVVFEKPLPSVEFCIVDMDQKGAGNGQEQQSAWQLTDRQLEALWVADKGEGRKAPMRLDPCAGELGAHKVGAIVDPRYGPVVFNDAQLEVPYTEGFFGQPSVAATMFHHAFAGERFTASQVLQAIRNAPVGRRVVVAGSMIGGTGAGCLPALVETLDRGLTGDGAAKGADIMALVLLKWFRLDAGDQQPADAANVRNETIRRNEPSGLIYATERLSRHAATVLVGHPDINRAAGTAYEDNTGQSVKRDLSLPYAAAISASNFLAGPDVGRGTYAVVADDGKTEARIPWQKALFGFEGDVHRIHDLIHRNETLCYRLAWVAQYLQMRPEATRSWFPGSLKVPGLEGVGSTEQLTRRVVALLDAKWSALVRLRRSDASLFGPSTRVPEGGASWGDVLLRSPPARGLETIASWFSQRPLGADGHTQTQDPLPSLCRTLLGGVSSAVNPPSDGHRGFLLPSGQTRSAQRQLQRALGDIETIDAATVRSLIPFEHVTPEGLPNQRAMEIFLGLHFDRKLTAALPNKHAQDWTRRWRLLLAGIVTGRFQLEAGVPEQGQLKVVGTPAPQWLVVDKRPTSGSRGVAIGLSSPETLFVPSATANWDELVKLEVAPDFVAARRVLVTWARLLAEVSEKSGAPKPGWLTEGLLSWQGDALLGRVDFQTRSTQTVQAHWNGARVALPLPLSVTAAGGLADRATHVQTVLRALGVRIEHLSLDAARGMGGRFEQLQQLADDARFPVYVPLGPDVKDARPRKVVWRHLHPDLADLIGSSAVLESHADDHGHPRCVAYFLQAEAGTDENPGRRAEKYAGVSVLDPEEVLVSTVSPIASDPDADDKSLPNYPVKLEYAGLVDMSRPVPPPPRGMEHSHAQYLVPLRGLPAPYAKAVAVRTAQAGTWMLWPKFRTAPERNGWFKAYVARASSAAASGRTCFVGIDHDIADAQTFDKRPLNASATVDDSLRPQPLYARRKDGRGYQGLVPEAFAVLDANDHHGGGLFSTALKTTSWMAGERWGIDFGSSSSVVAALGPGGTRAEPMAPRGALDQTAPYALMEKPEVAHCNWYPTWEKTAPRSDRDRIQPLFSSKLLLTQEFAGGKEMFNADQRRFGYDFVVDHGGPVSPYFSRKESYIEDMKWLEDKVEPAKTNKRSQRRAYLRLLLELCFALRERMDNKDAGLAPGLPRQVDAVFTLPIRLATLNKQAAEDFGADVQEICSEVGSLVGVQVQPSFMWESAAGAPQNRMDNQVYAVADLGGGTLDMWGGLSVNGAQFADSYKFGGHDLINQLQDLFEARGEVSSDIDYRRSVRGQQENKFAEFIGDESNGAVKDLKLNFFEEAKEATARWVAALAVSAREAGLSPDDSPVRIQLNLLGMGWSLAPETTRQEVRNDIFLRAAELLRDARPADHAGRWPTGIDFGQQLALEEGVQPKTYLARRAAQDAKGSDTLPRLLQEYPHAFLGFDLVFKAQEGALSERASWVQTVPLTHSAQAEWRAFFHPESTLAQPSPALDASGKAHQLVTEEIDKILQTLRDDSKTRTYTPGKGTPMAHVLEQLRSGRSLLSQLLPSRSESAA